jgi:hypothetical protein
MNHDLKIYIPVIRRESSEEHMVIKQEIQYRPIREPEERLSES